MGLIPASPPRWEGANHCYHRGLFRAPQPGAVQPPSPHESNSIEVGPLCWETDGGIGNRPSEEKENDADCLSPPPSPPVISFSFFSFRQLRVTAVASQLRLRLLPRNSQRGVLSCDCC